MYSEACALLVQAAGYAGAHILQNEEVEKRDSRAGRHAVPRVRRTVQEVRGMLGGRQWSSSGGEGTQQSNIKPTSTVRTVVVTTARAMTKAARAATVAGDTRTTAMLVTTVATAATMTPNGNKSAAINNAGTLFTGAECGEMRPAADQRGGCITTQGETIAGVIVK
jgi:hypothetical protein